MIKIAFFVEGLTEQIFVEKLLYNICGYIGIEPKPMNIREGLNIYRDKPKPDTDYYFLIYDARNDEKAITEAVDKAPFLLKTADYKRIIIIRDLYSKSGKTKIRREHKNKVIEKFQNIREKFGYTEEQVSLVLSIMEIEAWFIADHNVFEKISYILTPEYIKENSGIDLIENDPEIAYEHPTNEIKKIYKLVEKQYGKHERQICEITDNLDYDYLDKSNKIASFHRLVNLIESAL